MIIKNISAVISGGASGMGAATARSLSAAGAKVAILDRNISLAEKVAADIQGIAVECDVTQEESVLDALKIVREKQGPARICINCAGIIHSRRMVNQAGPMPLSEFRQVIEINLMGSFNVMRIAANEMIPLETIGADKERGIIINTASVAAYEGQIGQTAYSASKGGIVGMTLPAARELAQFGIRVMTIAPGLVDTPMFDKLTPEAKSSLENMVPFPKRLAQPEEYALLAKSIIENVMLNGTVIRLDGALRMQAK
ncbi:MAG TPA: SDR family NAD(P)-dependent oxidoreductase [Gammaproteobacteria bacterium]|nr:SDR family NAD(P)-dependent oxidoreductase [Gammaproteobacteria bacterium]